MGLGLGLRVGIRVRGGGGRGYVHAEPCWPKERRRAKFPLAAAATESHDALGEIVA